MVSRRHAKANNEQCPDCNPEKPKTWTQYLDVNTLYGWSMKQSLLVSGFQSVVPTIYKALETSDDAPEGYILETDIEYPDELHDPHNDYPLTPEAISIKEEWLSQYHMIS